MQTLIKSDTSLAQQIEQFLKKQEILLEKKKEREENNGLDPREEELSEEDYAEFFEAIAEEQEKDKELQKGKEKDE